MGKRNKPPLNLPTLLEQIVMTLFCQAHHGRKIIILWQKSSLPMHVASVTRKTGRVVFPCCQRT